MPSFRSAFGGKFKRAPVLPDGAAPPAASGKAARPPHEGPAPQRCWSGMQEAEPAPQAVDINGRSSLRAAGSPRLSLAAAFGQHADLEEPPSMQAAPRPSMVNAASAGRPPIPRDVPPGPPRLSCPWEAQPGPIASQRRANPADKTSPADVASAAPAAAGGARKRPASASSRASPAAAVTAAFAASRASAGRAASAARATWSSLASPRHSAQAPSNSRPVSASSLRATAASHEETYGHPGSSGTSAHEEVPPDKMPVQGRSRKESISRRRQQARQEASSAAAGPADMQGWTGAAVRRRRPVYKPDEATVIDEADLLTKTLIVAVYEQPLAEEQAAMVLSSCPEVEWLVQCALNSPVPAGWHKSHRVTKDGYPGVCYTNMLTGEESKVMPHLERFSRLARLAIHARRSPGEAQCAAAWVRAARDEALRDTQKARDGWSGPHVDKTSGAEFYHCPATGASSWTSPSASMAYLATVAEQLLCSEAFTVANIHGEEEGTYDMKEQPASPADSEETLEEVAAEVQRSRFPPRAPQAQRSMQQARRVEQPAVQNRPPVEHQAMDYTAEDIEDDEEEDDEEEDHGEEEEEEDDATPAVSRPPAARTGEVAKQPLVFDLYEDDSEGSEDGSHDQSWGMQEQSWGEQYHMEVGSVTHVTPSRHEYPSSNNSVGQDTGNAAAALANAAAAMAAAAVALAGIHTEASGSQGLGAPEALRSAAVALQAVGQAPMGAMSSAAPSPPSQMSAIGPTPPSGDPVPLFTAAAEEDTSGIGRHSVPRLSLQSLSVGAHGSHVDEAPCVALAPMSNMAAHAANAERPIVIPRLNMSELPPSATSEGSSEGQCAPEKAAALETMAQLSGMMPSTDSIASYPPSGHAASGPHTLRTTSVCSSVVAASVAAGEVASTATTEATESADVASTAADPDRGVEAAVSAGAGSKSIAVAGCTALEARISATMPAVGGG